MGGRTTTTTDLADQLVRNTADETERRAVVVPAVVVDLQKGAICLHKASCETSGIFSRIATLA